MSDQKYSSGGGWLDPVMPSDERRGRTVEPPTDREGPSVTSARELAARLLDELARVRETTPRQSEIGRSDAHACRMGAAALRDLDKLDDRPDHVIELGADGWTLQHPLACRLAGALFDCPLNRALSSHRWDVDDLADGRIPGRYVIRLDETDGAPRLEIGASIYG